MTPTPVLSSRVENLTGTDTAAPAQSAFAPISTFESAASVAAAAQASQEAHDTGTESTNAPTWVVAYLVLCAALTLIGLVVLYFEHRLLGNASPL